MSVRAQPSKKHIATPDRNDSEADYRITGPLDLILHPTNKHDQPDPDRRKSGASRMSVKTALSLLLTHIIESLALYALSMHPMPDWAEPDAGHSGHTANKSPAPNARNQSLGLSETDGTVQDARSAGRSHG
jgi:hypothetical protein